MYVYSKYGSPKLNKHEERDKMDDLFEGLVSPETGCPLKQVNNYLVTIDKTEMFEIQNGIACLLKNNDLDMMKLHELDVFNSLPIKNTSYFRESLFEDINAKVLRLCGQDCRGEQNAFSIVEMGGGEGYWARHIKTKLPQATVFVCDLSMKMLERAARTLKRVCADVTRPVFERKSIRMASFWVSLHHLNATDRERALRESVGSLEDGGLLLIFEPNIMFFLRSILYKSILRKDVYFDEQEQAINFSEISRVLRNLDLVEVGTYFMNPPYNPDFVKKLKRWFIYLPAVELLHQIDRWILSPILGSMLSMRQSALKEYLSLYGLAIYRKGSV